MGASDFFHLPSFFLERSDEVSLNGGIWGRSKVGMTIDEMIAVLEAAKAGKQIQCKGDGLWSDTCPECGEPHPWKFNFGLYDYRVKPEPREWHIPISALRIYDRNLCGSDRSTDPVIRVREVLELGDDG